MVAPTAKGPSNLTPNQLPNSRLSEIARHTRSRGARRRTFFSMRSVLWLIRNLQVAHKLRRRRAKCNPVVACGHNRSRPGKAVAAPLFRADSVVHDEESIGIVLSLHVEQTRVVVAPIRVLPPLLEVIALAHVRPLIGDDRAQLIHALVDALRGLAALVHLGLMSRDSGISRALSVGDD